MSHVLKNRVKVSTTSTGTGTISLGSAYQGYVGFQNIGDENSTYYLIAGSTEWEVGIGEYDSSANSISRKIVLGSSNSNDLVNFSAGEKTVLCVNPSSNVSGGLPDCSDGTLSSTVWTIFQSMLVDSALSGSSYAGSISTLGLIYTTASAYAGGVLAMNGDIHFIPFNATVGQKISKNGTVSTYSLVYTTTGAYFGGVLAPNGDIHFVPYRSTIGQKINNFGQASTYSLSATQTTATGLYAGGVMASNGEIHFVPYSATFGQKISVSGVVSTYSIPITAGNSKYMGGVLGEDGSAYFIPTTTTGVGTRISSSGVVSTYTAFSGSSYSVAGGVLGLDGKIYYVPADSSQDYGVFRNKNGTYGTYSLPNKFLAACGGVLTPNGDIYFVPEYNYSASSNRATKVNKFGVASTYSISNDAGYVGGVLDMNGNVVFVPGAFDGVFPNQNVATKIYTNSAIPFSPGVCVSPFLNKF